MTAAVAEAREIDDAPNAPDPTMPMEWRLAYHESGHAVAEFVLLGRSSTVVIASRSGSSTPDVPANLVGPARFDEWIEGAVAARADTAPGRRTISAAVVTGAIVGIERNLQVLMAGPLAESIASGLPLERMLRESGRSDHREWNHQHQQLARLRDADRASDWARFEELTRALLAEQWQRVERLTGALLVSRRLEPSHVRTILTTDRWTGE